MYILCMCILYICVCVCACVYLYDPLHVVVHFSAFIYVINIFHYLYPLCYILYICLQMTFNW